MDGVKVSSSSDFFCDSCQLGKSHKFPFQKQSEKRNTEPGKLIHNDVSRPMSEMSLEGAKFFVTFKDDAIGYRYVYFMKHKADVYECFKEVEREIANKCGRKMRILRSDGREYCNVKMDKYLSALGIRHERTAPYTSEQNGKSKRDNRTIVECTRTLLHAKDLSKFLWTEAVNTAVYMLNKISKASNDKHMTAYKAWTGRKPNLQHVRVFGSYMHVPKQFTTKFDARSKRMLVVEPKRISQLQAIRLYQKENRRVKKCRNSRKVRLH